MEKIKRALLLLFMVILLAGCGNPAGPINSETYETTTDTKTGNNEETDNSGSEVKDAEIITDAGNEETGNNDYGKTDTGNEETDNSNSGVKDAEIITDAENTETGITDFITDNETGETDTGDEETGTIDFGETDGDLNNNTDYSYLYEYNYADNRYYYYDLNADMTIFYGEWESSDGEEKFIFNNDDGFIYEKNGNTITGKYGTLNSGADFYGEVDNQIIFFCQFNFLDLNRLYLGPPNEGKLFEKISDDEPDYNYLYNAEYISSGYYPDWGASLNRFYGEWGSSDGKEKFIFYYDDFIYEKNGVIIKGKYKTLNNGADLYGENREYEIVFWVPFQFIDSSTLYLGVENKGKLFEKLN
jgi:hypothetical protein